MYAVYNAHQGRKDDPEIVKDKLCGMFENFSPLVKDMLKNTPEVSIMRSDVSDLKRLTSWNKDRICLLGDAAHATTPNMGQGGAQGVEDEYYITNILAKENDPEKAFLTFEKGRRKKVDTIVNTSWTLGKFIHHPLGQTLLKLSNKITPDKIIKNQMQKLFAVENL